MSHRDKAGKVSWYRQWELDKVRKGYRFDPEFGWLTPLQAAKLSKGLLWWEEDKTWRPRAEVEELRRSWENRWTFETEHFQIATNAPLAEAIAFGRDAEHLYLLFFRVFADLYAAEDKKLAGLLVFGGGKTLGRKLGIHYYGSRASYLEEIQRDRELRGSDLGLELQSAGFYTSVTGKVYFYRGTQGPDLSTVFHEVTHQIFGETFSKCPGGPCWLKEGLAVLLESAKAVGEGEAHRLLVGAEIPLGFRVSARDIDCFLKTCGTENKFHGDLRLDNYAMAGAVVHFFYFHRGGAYREGFVRYARSALRGATPVQELYKTLGVSEKQLQKEWKEFCRNPSLFSF